MTFVVFVSTSAMTTMACTMTCRCWLDADPEKRAMMMVLGGATPAVSYSQVYTLPPPKDEVSEPVSHVTTRGHSSIGSRCLLATSFAPLGRAFSGTPLVRRSPVPPWRGVLSYALGKAFPCNPW